MFRPVALLLAITAACGAAPSDDPFADGEQAARPNQLPLSVPEIESAARFRAVSFADGGLLVLGRSVKFLVDHRDKAHPVVHFVNANFPGGGFFFSSRRRHTSCLSDWSSDVCSSD